MAEQLIADHEELDALGRSLLDAFVRADAAEVLAKLDLVWARLAVHIRAEHLHLFPALLTAAEGGASRAAAGPPAGVVEETLSKLREDHNFFMRELAACVEALRMPAADASPMASEDLERVRLRVLAVFERLRAHNRLEEEEVYHWPRALLSGAEGDRLDAAVRRELGNMPPRFDGR